VQLKSGGFLAIASWLLYRLAFGDTFSGSLSWIHQIIADGVYFAAFVITAAILLRRRSPLCLRCLTPTQNIAIGLVVLDQAVRAAVNGHQSRDVPFPSEVPARISGDYLGGPPPAKYGRRRDWRPPL
jgi:hypothetical protein